MYGDALTIRAVTPFFFTFQENCLPKISKKISKFSQKVVLCNHLLFEGTIILNQPLQQLMLQAIIDAYIPSFDIERDVIIDGEDIAVFAEYHSRTEKYVLVKSAKLWGAEANEYIFVATRNNLDLNCFYSLKEAVLKEGLSRIKPHSEHMCSYISLIILADCIDSEAIRLISKTRYQKRYRLSFHGWMEFRITALELSSGSITANPAGKSIREFLDKLQTKSLKEENI